MKSQVIAVDIDEVLQPLHEPVLNYHNEKYGSSFVYPDPENRYFLQHFTGDTSEDANKKIQSFVKSASFEAIKPLPGAINAISQLKLIGHELFIITARQDFYKAATDRFLQRYFPDLFSDVHFIPFSPDSALQPADAKLAICQQIQANYLIDDNLGVATKAGSAGLGAVLFGDYHWNKAEKLPEGVTRCKDWNAVLEYFDARG